MNFLNRTALALLAAILASAGAFAEPLPTDPNLVTGQLDNGLKYIIRKHSNPPGRATVWMHIDSGSLNETEKQRGLAHYLEHMAFNGSENFPPGAVVPFFQSLGMTFGRDQNAFTSFNQTVYQLSLPDTKPETLSKGMTFFGDVLYRLSMLPTEIDEERGIIQEERRRSLSGRQRTSYYVLEHMAPGSIFGQRITIGTEETINSVMQEDFKDYYGKYYTASNATVIVVADTDPAQVVTQIRDQFEQAPKKPRPAPQQIGVKAYNKSFAIVTSDPEIKSEQLRITRLEPARAPTTTTKQFRDDLVARLSEMAFNRRIDDTLAIGGISYLGGGASLGNQAGAIYTAEISVRPAPGKWRQALEEMALEVQRARAFGFSSAELDDTKKQVIAQSTRSVQTESTLPAQVHLDRINDNIANGEPTISAQQNLDLINTLLPSITPQEVSARFATEFDPTAVAFIAILPSGAQVPSESELLDIGSRALAVTPTPRAESTHAASLMESLPKPGTIAESADHPASGVWSAWLANNARVQYRFMDSQKDQVTVTISLLGGELLETADTRGITQAASRAWSRPATKHLSSSDIRALLTGKNVSVRGGGGGGGRRGGGGGGLTNGMTLGISGSPADLETGMQLAYLLLTEPKIETAGFEQFKTQTRQTLEEALGNPASLGSQAAEAAPYPDDEVRTKPLTVAQLDRLNQDAAQAWLEKLIATSPIEVTIVGDLPKEKAVELVTRYVASLPSRDRVSPSLYLDKRRLTAPKGPRVIEKTLQTITPQAFVSSGFYGADETNIADARALSVASRVISTRMIKQLREDAQLVYSIGAGSRPASTYPGFGVFSSSATTDPAKVPALVQQVAQMYAAFAKDGPTADELALAKKQIANTFASEVDTPAYWLARLNLLTFRGNSLDDIVGAPAAFQAISASEVQGTFAKYYSKDHSIIVTVIPTAPTEGAK